MCIKIGYLEIIAHGIQENSKFGTATFVNLQEYITCLGKRATNTMEYSAQSTRIRQNFLLGLL
jgi:hypothetical protein